MFPLLQEMHSRMPTLYVIDEHLTFEEYAGLYKVRAGVRPQPLCMPVDALCYKSSVSIILTHSSHGSCLCFHGDARTFNPDP
jgi:hypothetical protein